MKKNMLLLLLLFNSLGVFSQWMKTVQPVSWKVYQMGSKNGIVFLATDSGIYRSLDDGYRWTLLGWNGIPANNIIQCFLTVGNDIFVGTDSGGVFRTQDDGASWQSQNTGFPGTLKINCLAFHDSSLFAGTQNNKIYKSSVSSINWNFSSSGLPPYPIYSFCVKGDTIFTGNYTGIYASADDGATWFPRNTGLPTARVKAIFSNNNILLAGSSLIYKSLDNGNTWTPISTTFNINDVNSFVYDGTRLFVTSWAFNGVWSSTDGGLNWYQSITEGNQLLNSGNTIFASSERYNACKWINNRWSFFNVSYVQKIVPVDSIVYITHTNAGISISTDSALHWNSCGMNLPDPYIWSAQNADRTIFVGTSNGNAFISTNNGIDWVEADSGLNTSIVHDFLYDGIRMLAGTQQGVFQTFNNGISWSHLGSHTSNWSVRDIAWSGSDIYINTYDSLFRTPDNGNTWIPLSLPGAINSITALGINGSTIYMGLIDVNSLGIIFKSVDSGSTWIACDTTAGWAGINSFAFRGTNIFASITSGFLHSPDNGLNWNEINDSLPSNMGSSYGEIKILGNELLGGYLLNVYKRPISDYTSCLSTITSSGLTNICQGNTVTLQANTGAGFSYQWKKNGIEINGATSSSFIADTTGNYSCDVTMPCGTQNSNSILVSFVVDPEFIWDTLSIHACDGKNTTISAWGNQAGLLYHWQENGVDLNDDTIYSGTHTPTLRFTSTPLILSQRQYRCIITNPCSFTDTSRETILSVDSSVHADVTIAGTLLLCTGMPGTFSAATSGANPIYDWRLNGFINGVHGPSFTDTLINGDEVSCIIRSDSSCYSPSTDTSNTLHITINIPTQPVIIFNFDSLTSTMSSGYQWYRNNVLIPGATNRSYVPHLNGSYTVLITDSNGCTSVSLPYYLTNVFVQELNNGLSVTIFPNPARDIATIEINFAENEIPQVLVMNATGQTVSEIKNGRRINNNAIQLILESAELENGIYFLKIRNEDQIFYKKFLVLN